MIRKFRISGSYLAAATVVPILAQAVLATLLILSDAASASASESSQITELQNQFRKLGGSVVSIKDVLHDDYRIQGRSSQALEVADILSKLRDAHMAEAVLSPKPLLDILSAMSANRAGRDLLQSERDHVSLLNVAKRHRINTVLRNFYDSEIDLSWFFSKNGQDTEIVDAMFRSAELSRARDFLGSVYHRMDLGSRPDAEKAFARLEAFLAYQETLIDIRNYQVSGERASAYIAALKNTITTRSAEFDYSALQKMDAPGIADTGVMNASSYSAHVGIGEAVIMYHMTQSHTYAFVLLRNTPPRVLRLPANTTTLRQYIQSYYTQLSSGPSGRGVGLESGIKQDSWRVTGKKLYEMLFAPLEPYLGLIDRLLIIPHGLIHLVPFAALPVASDGDSFLIDRFTIVVSPTPMYRAWSSMRRRDPQQLAMVVGINNFGLANRLKYAEEEATSVARTLGNSQLVLGSRGQATYQNVINDIEKFSIIHIASHGLYIPDAPGASHVLLRGNGVNSDVPLMAIDILGKRLNASLVVLSACNTATVYGKGLPPDGDILGLPRALLIAGAERVIASLWAVNDKSTQELFDSMYRMAYGKSAGGGGMLLSRVELDVALANAQKKIRNRYPDPYYWAPFILIGVP